MNHSLVGKLGSSKKRLVIGVDFGAAFSKVIIGDSRVRYAVPFGEFSHPDNPYLLPSILNIENNNLCRLSSAEKADHTTDNLKLRLLDKNCSDEDCLPVVAFLALVFRASQDWLLGRYQKRYARNELSWTINASLPADTLKHSPLAERYPQLLHHAWTLSVLPGPITLTRVRQFMRLDETAFDKFPALYRSKLIAKNSVNVFSACNVQICAYVHSKKCSDDLHMLIDVGAMSISIATFMVEHNEHDANKNRCTLYACAVEATGVDHFLKRRYANLQLSDDEINLFNDIPDNHAFSQAHDLTEKDINFADTLYSGDVARLINKVMALTKQQYCPDSTHWESGVLTFTYGGGAQLEILQNIIQRFENKAPPRRIVSIAAELPHDLMAENLSQHAYHRLSVAYGLSFDADDITSVVVNEFSAQSEQTAKA